MALARGDARAAARLLAAGAHARDLVGVTTWTLLRSLADAFAAAVRDALDPDAHDREREAGAALHGADALTFALEATRPAPTPA